MNKKENRMAVRQTVEKAVLRDEQNQRIQFAAANPVQEVLKKPAYHPAGTGCRGSGGQPHQVRLK